MNSPNGDSPETDYWVTPIYENDGPGNACFGREACRQAYKYLLRHDDVAEAKRIAANYCVANLNECVSDARAFERGKLIEGFIAALVAGGRSSSAVSAVRKTKGWGCKCFLAGTDVLMADGTTKDIEDIEFGDEVLATDPETGETGPRKVTRLIVTDDDKHFNELSIATADGIEKLTATHEHPFWSPSERDWMEAGELTAGMTLRTDTGDTVIVTGNRAFSTHARTYNLTVDDLHTYYVLAGETPVLVHNSGGPSFDLTEMDAPGHSNYVLVDKSNRVYYVGRFGPNETPATVQKRHGNNHDRFNPAKGDKMSVFPGTRTYGQARLLEQRMMEYFGTYVGRGPTYRGNRDNPMESGKKPAYLAYESYKNGGCP